MGISEKERIETDFGPLWSGVDSVAVGDRIFTAKRLFNVAAGVSRADDTIPPRITSLDRNEKVRHVPPEAFQRMLDEYYQLREWDAEGRPRPGRLDRLGLRAPDPVLAP